jgi:hypothetical protein
MTCGDVGATLVVAPLPADAMDDLRRLITPVDTRRCAEGATRATTRPGATSAGPGEHSPATTTAGAPLPAGSARPSDAGPSNGAANRAPAGHPDQALHASQIASAGGPAINGAGLSRPAPSTNAVGGPTKGAAGALNGLNGSSFRPKYP